MAFGCRGLGHQGAFCSVENSIPCARRARGQQRHAIKFHALIGRQAAWLWKISAPCRPPEQLPSKLSNTIRPEPHKPAHPQGDEAITVGGLWNAKQSLCVSSMELPVLKLS